MENRMCSVKGCEKPPRTRTAQWCPMHYHRWYRHGDPEVSLLGHGFVDFHGYRVVPAPDHPLARKRGDVLEHRKVLFDAIGPGDAALEARMSAQENGWVVRRLRAGVDLCPACREAAA